MGQDPHSRRLVAEVPVGWTNEDVERLSGLELEDRFRLDGGWENTGDPVVAQDEIKFVGKAPDDAHPDVAIDGAPLAFYRDSSPSDSNGRNHDLTKEEQLIAAIIGHFPGAEEWDYGEDTWEDIVKRHVDKMLSDLLDVIEEQDELLSND